MEVTCPQRPDTSSRFPILYHMWSFLHTNRHSCPFHGNMKELRSVESKYFTQIHEVRIRGQTQFCWTLVSFPPC